MWAMLPARERNDYIFTTRQKNSNSDEIFSGKETQKSQFLYNEFYKSFFFSKKKFRKTSIKTSISQYSRPHSCRLEHCANNPRVDSARLSMVIAS